jgi:hypothetical protein
MSSTTADPEPAEVSTSCPEPASFAVQEPAVTASAESATAAADSCDKKLSARIQPHVTAAAVETVVRKQRCHVDSCGEELASRAQLRAHLRQVTETLSHLCEYLLRPYSEDMSEGSQLLNSFMFALQLDKFKFVFLFYLGICTVPTTYPVGSVDAE